MAIYTRTGDRGHTGLFSGERVDKDDVMIEALGSVDELSSILGALAAALPSERDELLQVLQGIQTDLFAIGAWMSVKPLSPMTGQLKVIEGSRVAELENQIDVLQESMPAITRFILPGGHVTSAWAHVARSVCRRAERRAVSVFRGAPREPDNGVHETILRYLNRLSDYLFVLARYCNVIQGVQDVEWAP